MPIRAGETLEVRDRQKPMFTAVGDDDQAIYARRGATIENLKTLQVDFPQFAGD